MTTTILRPGGIAELERARLDRQVESLPTGQVRKAKEAAEAFESVYLAKMLENMRTGLSGSVLSGGEAEDTWQSFMTDEYAKEISRAGGVGIADAVLKVMLNAQESR